jgi:thiamine-phosphate pyrophosphorylase
LYLITDRTQMRGRPLLEVVAAALRGGVDAVQLREKDATARELVEWGRALRRLCDEHGARLLINDRIDVALAVDADGAHLPATSFLVADARRLLGNRLIGVSCHSLAEIDAVRGADFAVLGPIYATPSKAAYGAPLGPVTLEAAVGRAAMPVLAIGGIDTARAAEVRARGAAGIAVIRAICAADDPTAATVALRREPPPR